MADGREKSITYEFDEFQLCPSQRSLKRRGERVILTPRVFDLLLVLVEHRSQVVTKETLLETVWADANVEEGNINRTVSTLRKHLGRQPDGSDFIETVPKVGYRFIAPVSVIESVDNNVEVSPANEAAPSKPSRKIWKFAAGALGLLVVVGLAVFIWQSKTSDAAVTKLPGGGEVRQLTNSKENEQVAGWLADGRIVLTRWKDANTPETFYINEDGNGLTKASGPTDLRQGIWSPDGTRVLYWKYSDNGANAYLANSDGSKAVKLAFPVENAMWSPDGTRIVFQSAKSGTTNLADTEILIYSVADGRLTPLTNNSSFDGDPGWSPDGKSIAFVSGRDGNYEIYSMPADGSDIRRLTNNPGHDSFPKYAPDGTQILFTSNIESETTDVYVMNTNGGVPVRLTFWKSNELTRNGWSPDGTQIAFNSDREGNDDIFVMNVEPFAPKLLIEAPDSDLQTPSDSPDGRFVAYTAEFPDKHSELRIFDKNTKASKLVLRTSSSQNYPRWSPDGNWIAFHQEIDGKWDVFKVKPDATGLVNLTNNPASDSLPTWSGDGSMIYFRSNRNGDSETSEIFKMNSDGSDQTALPISRGKLGWPSLALTTDQVVFAADRTGDPDSVFDIFISDATNGNERLLASLSKNDIQPLVSPVGDLVAFVASRDGNQEIYLVNSDDSRLLRVTRNNASDLHPSFSFDGNRLIFSSNRGGKFSIYELVVR